MFWEMQNFETVKRSLEQVTDIHHSIKGEAEIIRKSANKEYSKAEKKMEKAKKEKWEVADTMYSLTCITPGVSQVIGAAGGAGYGVALTVDKIDEWELHPAARVPLKFIGGGLAAVGGAAVGTVCLMPIAICGSIEELIEVRDNAKYKELSNKFLDMGTQMEMVGARLDTITYALEIIDDKF